MSTSEPMLNVLRALGLLCSAVATFALAQPLASISPLPAPAYGLRGKHRNAARKEALFRLLETPVAQLAGWLARLPLAELRARLVVLLRHAGEPSGWSADELLAQTILALLFLGGAAVRLLGAAELGPELTSLAVLLSAALPLVRVRARAKLRAKLLERSLPVAMDLCVLCMGAGADFPSALTFVTGELGAAHEVCREELSQLLDELALGRTRVEALSALATRSSSVAVREFVSAICQSEEKGTPMIDALTIQSTTLRQRRTVRAEELAAQAGVKMMLPLMLLVASLMLVIFGPLIVTGIGL